MYILCIYITLLPRALGCSSGRYYSFLVPAEAGPPATASAVWSGGVRSSGSSGVLGPCSCVLLSVTYAVGFVGILWCGEGALIVSSSFWVLGSSRCSVLVQVFSGPALVWCSSGPG